MRVNVACGAQFIVVCPAGETDYDVIFPGDDRGGGVDEVVEQRPAFGGMIAWAQPPGQGLVQRAGDKRKLQVQIDPQRRTTGLCFAIFYMLYILHYC